MMANDRPPPRLARAFLLWMLRDDLAEEVLGDLQEKFNATSQHQSLFRARVNYWYQALNYVRPFALKRRFLNPYPMNGMYKSYFRVGVRNLAKNKLHAGLNIAGLSVGMAVAFTIAMWIWDEVSFNKSFPNHDRVARVIQNVENNGEVQTWRSVPYPLAEEIRQHYGDDFSAVALTTGFFGYWLSVDDRRVKQVGCYAEPQIVGVFSPKILKGNADLTNPSTVLVSASAATALFGETNPLGKVVLMDGGLSLQIGAVYQDFPAESTLASVGFVAPWEALVSNTTWIRNLEDPWRPNSFALFVQLKPGRDPVAVSARIRDAKLKKVGPDLATKKPALFLEPMDRWHLYAEYKNGKNVGGRIQYVWMFGIVGGIVLLMACINFMNLSTARSEKRAREVGIRKVVGSVRGQLVVQFLCESVLIAFCAFVIAILLVQLSLPAFNFLSGKNMSIPWTTPMFWLAGVAFAFVTGILAGSYPAFYLSSLRSGNMLRGSSKSGGGALVPRKILVVVQFTCSIILIIGTVVVYYQVEYARNRPLGYESRGLVAVSPGNNTIHEHFDAVSSELEKSGAIMAAAEAASPTTESWGSSSKFDWNGKDPDLSIDFPFVSISHDYGKAIGWEIVDGRDFSRDFPSDSVAMIINQAAANYMGMKEPVGETIRWFDTPFQIIGVVRDIITVSPYEPVLPTVYYLSSDENTFVIMKIRPDVSASDALLAIKDVFTKFNPEQPFEYRFIDEEYARKFGNEERIGRIATYMASLAVLISCLGIFGLASFVAEQRTRELGIRKVLGAAPIDLWTMLSKDFVVLVVISCVLAIPLGFAVMQSWLQKYSYRTEIPWWVLAGSAISILLITLLTVSYQTTKAALTNPVNSLRSE